MTLVKVKVERGRLTQCEAKASRKEEIFRRDDQFDNYYFNDLMIYGPSLKPGTWNIPEQP